MLLDTFKQLPTITKVYLVAFLLEPNPLQPLFRRNGEFDDFFSGVPGFFSVYWTFKRIPAPAGSSTQKSEER